jgi:hypothetical protein
MRLSPEKKKNSWNSEAKTLPPRTEFNLYSHLAKPE